MEIRLFVTLFAWINTGHSLITDLAGHSGTDLSEEIPFFRFGFSTWLLFTYFLEVQYNVPELTPTHGKLIPGAQLSYYCGTPPRQSLVV